MHLIESGILNLTNAKKRNEIKKDADNIDKHRQQQKLFSSHAVSFLLNYNTNARKNKYL